MTDTSGPAFPHFDPETGADNGLFHCGMTLRDWFAGQAMQGMSANGDFSDSDYAEVAKWSYEQADAMLAERKKQHGT